MAETTIYQELIKIMSNNHISCKKYHDICGGINPHLCYVPIVWTKEEDGKTIFVQPGETRAMCELYQIFEQDIEDAKRI